MSRDVYRYFGELECVADYINCSDYVSVVERDVSKSIIIPRDLIK